MQRWFPPAQIHFWKLECLLLSLLALTRLGLALPVCSPGRVPFLWEADVSIGCALFSPSLSPEGSDVACWSSPGTFPALPEHQSPLPGADPVTAGTAGILPGPKREPAGGGQVPGRRTCAPGIHLTGERGAGHGTLGLLPVPNWEMLGLSSLLSRYR